MCKLCDLTSSYFVRLFLLSYVREVLSSSAFNHNLRPCILARAEQSSHIDKSAQLILEAVAGLEVIAQAVADIRNINSKTSKKGEEGDQRIRVGCDRQRSPCHVIHHALDPRLTSLISHR